MYTDIYKFRETVRRSFPNPLPLPVNLLPNILCSAVHSFQIKIVLSLSKAKTVDIQLSVWQEAFIYG